ncbi:O-Glycosyl hydrolase [Gracilibacillus orientalis]|uniref:O-Glycosyl hydrolase n=1 Tax=Gracilibacillus orientalis TaxID=334253 RepID=A0A1I4HUC5_9BACI|nr:glycoside hydrolase [Gracilibacillus orientalis]SFL45056.1 O-Glycosyl hydrolase [Gracilibacillus orientalis]
MFDISDKAQTIEGFGVSGAWWSQAVGGWTNDKRNQIINLLFDQDVGIGLSIYRYNIGAGSGEEISDPWRRTESFEVEKGIYNWSHDGNAKRVLKEIHRKGVQNFVAFANSPTARMTKSGLVTGEENGKSNLKEDRYEDFAVYLVDVINHLIKDEGIPITYLSPINEPQWDWRREKGQEGCHYTPDECVKLLKTLQNKIEQQSVKDVKVSAIEAGEWKTAQEYIDPIFTDNKLMTALTNFDAHSYWSEPGDKIKIANYMNKNYPSIKLNMSEWTEMQQKRDYGMDSALVLANTIHDDLTLANVSSWQYWIAVSKYDFHDGLIYTNEGTEDVEVTKRLWAMGNYSKFIRPGAKRIKLSEEPDSLKTSLFYDETIQQLIYVVINNDENKLCVPIKFNHFTYMEVFETSESNNLTNVYQGEIKEYFNVKPESVTTFIMMFE